MGPDVPVTFLWGSGRSSQPSGFVTITSQETPGAAVGTKAVMLISSETTTLVAMRGVPPMQLTVTVAPGWNPLPWIVIALPPSQTVAGTIESTLGGGLMVSSMSALDWQSAGAG